MKQLIVKYKITTIVTSVIILLILIVFLSIKGSLIESHYAKNVALKDAGVTIKEVSDFNMELGYDENEYVYIIDFIMDDTKYEYLIRAFDGSIIERKISYMDNSTDTVSFETAKRVALEDANILEENTNFINLRLNSSSTPLYEVEFIADSDYYTYQVSATDSSIVDKHIDEIENTEEDVESETLELDSNIVSKEDAKEIALMDAGVSKVVATFIKDETVDEDDKTVYKFKFYTEFYEFDYKVSASDGTILSKKVESEGTINMISNNTETIGLDKATVIALEHAHVNKEDVVFKTDKIEDDYGYVTYEIEFYNDEIIYRYEIDVQDGDIIKYSYELR